MKLASPNSVALVILAGLLPAAQAAPANGTVRTTAYTHTEADHLEYGRKTASGSILKHTKGYTSAAADWSKYPLGTKFKIKGLDTTFVVDDYGRALVGTETIDIYQPSRSAMNGWGVRHVDIQVIEKGDYEKSREILEDRKGHAHVRQMLTSIDQKKQPDGPGNGWFFRNRKDQPAPNPVPSAAPKPAAPARETTTQLASSAPKQPNLESPTQAKAPAPSTPAPAPAPGPVLAKTAAPVLEPALTPAPAAPASKPIERKIRPLETMQVASVGAPETAALISAPAPLAEPRKRAFRPL